MSNFIPPVTSYSPIPSAAPVSSVGQPQSNVVWVDGMKDVLDYPTAPNTQFFFPEKNGSIIWVRETDGNGTVKNPLKKLTYTMEETPFGPEANFVTKEEYKKLYDLVYDMSGKVADLCSQLK